MWEETEQENLALQTHESENKALGEDRVIALSHNHLSGFHQFLHEDVLEAHAVECED